MTINTKANIGDTVYFLYQNKVETAVVRHIKINVAEEQTQFIVGEKVFIDYSINGFSKAEEDIFLTKQELLDSL